MVRLALRAPFDRLRSDCSPRTLRCMAAARAAGAGCAADVEWIVRPTALLRRAQARYGEPFTLRTAWSDAPLVLVTDPEEIKRAYAAPPDVLQGGDSAAFLEPFVGPPLDPDPARRRAPAPAPAGAAAVPRRGAQALDGRRSPRSRTRSSTRGCPGSRCRRSPRMQALTLEVIQRVIFGSRDPELRDALREALDLTGSTPRLIAMSLRQRDVGPYARFLRAVERIDELRLRPHRRRRRRRLDPRPARGLRRDPRGAARPARDAARRRPRDDGDRARLGARAARPPPRTDLNDDAHIDAAVKEVLRTRPVLSITARKTLQPYRARRLHAPARRLRRRPACTSRTAAPAPSVRPAALPRRHAGAVHVRPVRRRHAPLPRRRVRRAGDARGAPSGRSTVHAAPRRAQGERMRRRSVTLAPARGRLDHSANPLA